MSKPLTLAEASAFTGIPRKTLYNLVWLKEITCYRPRGRLLYFKQEDLEEFVFRGRQASNYELNEKAEALLTDNRKRPHRRKAVRKKRAGT
jgi:excisionase family DNA binding protein